MLMDKFLSLFLPILFSHSFGIGQTLLIHYILEEIIPEALDKIELKLEHAHGGPNFMFLEESLSSFILSDFAHLSKILFGKGQVTIERYELQCAIDWEGSVHYFFAFFIIQYIVNVFRLALGLVSLIIDLVFFGA